MDFGEIADYLKAGLNSALTVGLGGVTIYASRQLPDTKKYSLYRDGGMLLGGAVALYGVYNFLKDTNLLGVTPLPKEEANKISVSITEPNGQFIPITKPWNPLVAPVTVKAMVNYGGGKGGRIWVGCSFYKPNGEIIDLPPQAYNLKGDYVSKEFSWSHDMSIWDISYFGTDDWKVRVSVWSTTGGMKPVGDCETTGDCIRMADDMNTFHFGVRLW